MTSRERILTAFRHEQPDRIPIFEKLIKPPVSDVLLGRPCIATNFAAKMDMMCSASWEELIEREARDLVELYEMLGLDMIPLGESYLNIQKNFEKPKKLAENSWRQGDRIIEFFPQGGYIREKPVSQTKTDKKESPSDEVSQAPSEEEFAVWRKAKELMKEKGLDLAIFARIVSPKPTYFPVDLLMAFYDKPKRIVELMQDFTRYAFLLIEAFAREGADVISFGGDTAGDKAPTISPDHYHRYYLPYMKKISDRMHVKGLFGSTASDGNLWPIIEDFLIKSGADGYEEIDKAAGMELKPLKEKFGNKICFIGNIDCRYTLCSGTPEEVEQETIKCIEEGWGNGGHILMSSNSIHEDVKPENYIAMITTQRSYFGYEAGLKSLQLKKKVNRRSAKWENY